MHRPDASISQPDRSRAHRFGMLVAAAAAVVAVPMAANAFSVLAMGPWDLWTDTQTAVGQGLYQVSLAAAAVAVCLLFGVDTALLLGLRVQSRTRELAGAVGPTCALLAVGVAAFLLTGGGSGVANANLHGAAGSAMIAAVVIGAPLAEELLFRGLLFGSARRVVNLPVAAIISSAAFVWVHVGTYTDALSLASVGTLGLLMCWVRERSGSLLLCVTMHSTLNAFSVAAMSNAGLAVAFCAPVICAAVILMAMRAGQPRPASQTAAAATA